MQKPRKIELISSFNTQLVPFTYIIHTEEATAFNANDALLALGVEALAGRELELETTAFHGDVVILVSRLVILGVD